MMEVKVRLFATLREQAGWAEQQVALKEGATVDMLMQELSARTPSLVLAGRPVYAAVNQQYVQRNAVLREGDEVALFPPVSGGSSVAKAPELAEKRFRLVLEPISVEGVAASVTTPDCGAVVTFSGTVRGKTQVEGAAKGTDFLVYEAYAEMAERVLAQIGDEILARWPKVKGVSIVHRLGRCEIGEPTVVIAVASPHRGDGSFEACAWAIERLKAIAPIWKQENWSDGQTWVEGPRQPQLDIDGGGNAGSEDV